MSSWVLEDDITVDNGCLFICQSMSLCLVQFAPSVNRELFPSVIAHLKMFIDILSMDGLSGPVDTTNDLS